MEGSAHAVWTWLVHQSFPLAFQLSFVLRALLSAFHVERTEAGQGIWHQRIVQRHWNNVMYSQTTYSALGGGAQVLVGGCRGLCEERLGLPHVGYSQFQTAPVDQLQDTAESILIDNKLKLIFPKLNLSCLQ